MNPALIQRLMEIACAAEQIPHGKRTDFYKSAALELGLSLPTLHRKLKEVVMSKPRKRRNDAGTSALSLSEAQLISALLLESIRNNGKQLSSVNLAIERLIANGLIKAERVDMATGEVKKLSNSAISRALRMYGLHPEQLLQPAPVTELASKHPNHVWQIDASICTQFYLADDGVKVMDKSVYYDGKPENMERIKKQRLWRYVATDHSSGWLYVEYVLGAESAENLCNVLINAMQKRHASDPVYGVPFILVTDPGAAMTSAITRNLCNSLNIDLIINKVGNARAKGQVEQAHNIVECNFESGLRLEPATSLEQINHSAWRWMRHFNSTAIHGRTKRSRYNVWQTIKQHELRIPPSIEACKELAISAPELRKVTPKLRVSFRGAEFDVSTIPNVMVGEKLLITRNPWRDEDSAQVICTGENGRDLHHVVYRINKNALGFDNNAAVIGESYKSHAETPAQVARKLLEQIVTGTDNAEDAAAARKGKVTPFGGAIDPHKHITDTWLPDVLTKRGESMDITNPIVIEEKILTHVEAAKRIVNLIGNQWQGAEHMAWLKQQYPNGVPEDAITGIAERLSKGASPLRIVK